jgi:cupin fold WbuC family metalloprotein
VRTVSDEVIEADEDVLRVDAAVLNDLKAAAARNPRKRIRICAHHGVADPLHEMLIVHARGAYVRPHKHMGKTESLHVVEGMADVVFFDEDGGIREVVPIGDAASGRTFYYRLAAPWYHTLQVTSDVLVFHEVTNGPFRRERTVFALWAPEEGAEGVGAFQERIAAAALAGSGR